MRSALCSKIVTTDTVDMMKMITCGYRAKVMSTNKSRLIFTGLLGRLCFYQRFSARIKLTSMLAAALAWITGPYSVEDRCFEIIPTLVSKSLGVSFLG